jgi:membrane-associated phospholipid phosphatase
MTPTKLPSPPLPAWTARQWLAWSAVAVLGLAIALALQTRAPARELFTSLNQWARDYPAGLWVFLTQLGEAGVLFLMLSPLLLWRPQAMFAVLAAVPLGGLFSVSLKALFNAPRPATVLDTAQIHVIGPLLNNLSFPSGHSITAFAAAAAVLACLVPGRMDVASTGPSANRPSDESVDRSGARPTTRVALLVAPVIGLAALVGFSRIAVGAHWPVDVLAGASGGWLAGLSGAWATRRFPKLWQSQISQFLLGQGLLVTALWLFWRPIEYPHGAVAVGLALTCVLVTLVGQWRATYRRLGQNAAARANNANLPMK